MPQVVNRAGTIAAMQDERPPPRLMVLLETQWDRKQLAACASRWQGTRGAFGRLGELELLFPPPADADCMADFDPLGFVEAAARGELGRIDAVTSSSDYPGAALAAAVASRLQLPGPRPERVLAAAHKYVSRLRQREAAPAAVPDFALLDPRQAELQAPLPFPFFVKPVKGAFSMLARRIDDLPALREFLQRPAVREFGDGYMAIFNRLVAAFLHGEIDGHWFLAEALLRGDQVTVEGFAGQGAIEILGVVDSTLHPNGSFAHFDYPSALPAAVQQRMADIARRVIAALGLEQTLFNIEMTYDAAQDRVAIIEVNPRICGQFGDLYQKVDGTNGYEVALALATGRRPRIERGAGAYAAAASFPLRVFEPVRVERAPDAADLAAAEALFPQTLVWSDCSAGEELADFATQEDGASRRYAVINVGGASRDELARRCDAVRERLGFRMRPL